MGAFPAGLVLHSWAGPAEATRALAALPGAHFSLSGHTLRLAPRKLAPMLAEVLNPPFSCTGVKENQGSEHSLRLPRRRLAPILAEVAPPFQVFWGLGEPALQALAAAGTRQAGAHAR